LLFPQKIVTSQGETLPDHDEVLGKPETRKLKIWQRRKKRLTPGRYVGIAEQEDEVENKKQ